MDSPIRPSPPGLERRWKVAARGLQVWFGPWVNAFSWASFFAVFTLSSNLGPRSFSLPSSSLLCPSNLPVSGLSPLYHHYHPSPSTSFSLSFLSLPAAPPRPVHFLLEPHPSSPLASLAFYPDRPSDSLTLLHPVARRPASNIHTFSSRAALPQPSSTVPVWSACFDNRRPVFLYPTRQKRLGRNRCHCQIITVLDSFDLKRLFGVQITTTTTFFPSLSPSFSSPSSCPALPLSACAQTATQPV